MAKTKTSNQWAAMIAGFEPVRPGEKTHTVSQAARLCGVSEVALRKALQTGRIAPQDCRAGEWGNGKKITLLTQVAVDKYMAAREESGKSPKISNVEKEIEIRRARVEELKLEQSTYLPGMPDNLQDAKLRIEQLKIERLEAENMLAKNQSMLIQDVIDINREVDMELIASLRSFVYRVTPRVAGESDILKIRTILEEELAEAMAVLERPPTNGTA